MSDWSQSQADCFVENETEFHLGALPTEQSHPATRHLSAEIAKGAAAGIAMLQRVDKDVEAAIPRVLGSPQWRALYDALAGALRAGGKICFSGCGATGRVSIMLEAAYRRFRREHPVVNPPPPKPTHCQTTADRQNQISYQ